MAAFASDDLAIHGGPKVRTSPFPPRRLFGKEEKQAAAALFDRAMERGEGVLGYNGPEEDAYGREFADFLGGGYADGVNSGTNALYVAVRALELPARSEVIVPAITDPGGVMPVALAGCVPVPADTEPGSYNIGAAQIADRLTERTAAIIVAHIAGRPADMDPILDLARAKGVPVIEDAAQAHGATYNGRPVGTFGDLAVFSMMFGKHHASGGQGGMVFTRDEELYWKVRRHADRGKPFGLDDAGGNVVAALNCNMDELHAAIGRVQLRKLPSMVARRRELAAAVAAGCERRLRAVRLVTAPPGSESVYWFLLLRLHLDRLRVGKRAVVDALIAEGVPAAHTYLVVPMRMPWVRSFFKGEPPPEFSLPNAEAADACHVRVSFHEAWTDAEVEDLVAALEKLERATLR